MKYYVIKFSNNANTRKSVGLDVKFEDNPFVQFGLSQNYETLPDYPVIFQKLFIGAPPITDIIEDGSALGYGLTLSKKTKTVFEKFNLGINVFHDLGFAFDDETHTRLDINFFRLQIIKQYPMYLNHINFSKSIWLTKDSYPIDPEIEVFINTYVEYIRLKYLRKKIYFKKLVFKSTFSYTFPDLFKLHELSTGLYSAKDLICSERLKNAIENNQLTGFEFSEIEIEFENEIL